MIRKVILSITLLNCVIWTATAVHTGHVYIDNNNNGIFDKGEKGLSGILVSDGLNVVKTANDGSFSLPGHPKEQFVFITNPSGYKTDNKYYYRINDEQKSYDFALQPYNGRIRKDGSHKYVHISDTEFFSIDGHDGWLDNVKNYATNEQAAFIIHTGDLCYEYGMKLHIKLMNTANMNCPVFYCIGNHDLVKGKYGEELFENIYGPVYYSFDVGSTHYIVVPMLRGDFEPKYTKEDVYRWLKNDIGQIPQGKPIVIFSHDLITYNNQFIYRVNEQEQINLHDHNLKAWVYGHWHINYMKKWGNVFAVSTAAPNKGGIDHSTNVFRVMYVDKHGNFKSELRYTYLNKKIQIASPMEGQVSFFASESIPLVVNVYSSESPVNEVTYTCLVDGKTIYTDKKLRQATDWCWNADVPLTVEQQKKKVTLKLKARFSNGETVESERTFICQSVMREVTLTGNWENLLGNPQHAVKDQMALKPPLQLAWTKNIGANIYMASPLVYDGKIYVASVDENLKGEAYVYSLDGKTGEFVWKYQVRNSIKNTIAAGDGQVLVQDAQGYLYAIDAKSGQLSWEMQLSINVLPSLVEGLVVSNDIVYAGTGEGLCAINIKNGKVIWRNVNWRQNMGATATLSVGKNVLIGSSQWGALYANDLVTGRLKWKASADGLRNRAASAAIHGDLLYIISNNSLFIMKTDNGKVIARKELPFVVDVTSTPLLTDNEIIFGSTRNGLIALDSQTFDVKWKFNTNSALVLSSPYSGKHSATIETSPILAGNTVYVGASDGMIYGVNKGNGQLVWKYETGAPIFSSVAISGNALIATDFGGNVYTFVTQE